LAQATNFTEKGDSVDIYLLQGFRTKQRSKPPEVDAPNAFSRITNYNEGLRKIVGHKEDHLIKE
jgi:hypothetical protein